MSLIDSHCHLTYEPMFSNIEQLLVDCEKNKIINLLSISTNLNTAKKSIEIASRYETIFTTLGLHPSEVKQNSDELESIFSLYDKIGCDSKVTEYRNPLNGNWHENRVSELFFSAKNIQTLQNGIMQGVLQGSNGLYNIGPQCTDTLKIIMRSIYLSSAKNLPSNSHEQVNELNKLVKISSIFVEYIFEPSSSISFALLKFLILDNLFSKVLSPFC